MANKSNQSSTGGQQYIAVVVLISSALALIGFGVTAIMVNRDNAMTIFNTLLPVVSSWVGTILAFYFGRRNFEAAGELAERFSPADQVKLEPISNIMRPIAEMKYYTIPQDKSEADVKLAEIKALFAGEISRIPVLTADHKIIYMIHKSRVDEYLTPDLKGKESDTLKTFVDAMKQRKVEFSIGQGFALVSEKTLTAEAKQRIDTTPAQDIFITKTGKIDEPVLGWISNNRLCKYLEA